MAEITLEQIYQLAIRAGLGEEGARAVVAIAKTEGGLKGATGDQDIGGSFGPFQFYAGGQLPNYAKALGMTPGEAAWYAQNHPEHAAQWALRGYLGTAIKNGL